MKWYQLDVQTVERKLQVNTNRGLSQKQASERIRKHGPNVLKSQKKTSKWLIFLKQFQDFMVLVLLAATLIAGLLGENTDAIAIMVIVLVNAFIGYFQEQKAENSLEKLKELSAPLALVQREEKWEKVNAQNLAVGDVIKVGSGDRVPADIRIIQSSGMEVEESALTGESLPVPKHATAISSEHLDPQDQANMGFMGTLVTRGSGVGIVVGTGMNTVMGQIATLMTSTEKMITPLERKLAELGKILIVVALFLTALVVLLGVVQGNPVYDMFLAGVSLAVAAIPEGLPAIVTVALSLGVQRMIKKKAIVRKLSAVETLGSASVICSDKTGTMTENKMTVKELFLQGKKLTVTGDGYSTDGQFLMGDRIINKKFPALENMLFSGMLCNNASIRVKKGKRYIEGDPTDGALLIAARKYGLNQESFEHYKVIEEIPFDSDRKRMSVIVEDQNQMQFLITKGAPDVLLSRCSHLNSENGKQYMHKEERKKIEQAVDDMADQALRTIAIAMKPLSTQDKRESSFLEKDLMFIGLYGMMDPPRKEVKRAIADCREAGIKTVMITGDHVKTASAIAKQLELMPEEGQILDGTRLNELSVSELKNEVDNTYVFARVTPEHKLKIVKAFQEKGHIVAMTGDGVNDAPAIKASDIGISMGLTGTDVTKEASSLILMDDNFATIKAAIQEGRNIYENIRKFIRYLLASNVGEILVMLFAMLLAMPLPLVPVQILWVNLVTDGLPALALGMDKAEDNVMKQKPRNPKEGVFARGLGYKIISRGILIGIVTLIGFVTAYHNSPENLVYAQTIAFATLVLAQLIHVFDCRNEHSIFDRHPFGNIYLVLAVISSILLLLVVIYWAPLQPVFHTTALGLSDWIFIGTLAAIPSVIFGFTKK
jgi:Ca2+-transporting ATPase